MKKRKKQNIWPRCKINKILNSQNERIVIKMPKMTGLGKGLDALFGPVPEEEQVQENDTLKNLKITEVEPNRDQPRKRCV